MGNVSSRVVNESLLKSDHLYTAHDYSRSSGAVAEGMVRMKLENRPTDLPSLQACAAIGQMGLIQTWSSVLEKHSIQTAQVLLTHDDLADRRRYLNLVMLCST